MGVKKSWVSKYKEIPCIFFPTKIGQKTREFLLLFFAKIFRNVRNFLTKLIFFIFFHFFTTDTLKRLLRGPETIRMIYEVVFEKNTGKSLVF